MRKVLVTGAAGFIGSNLVDRLIREGNQVIGVDNFNNYYDPKIKEGNLKHAKLSKHFKLFRDDILDFGKMQNIFSREKIENVIHLAARAGVRQSIISPQLYSQVNIVGTVNLLKLSADFKVQKFIFGSSSSVYGNSQRLPFIESDPCDAIVSPYGASKRAAEFFIESFVKTNRLDSVILRFFTVYGPRGRPDMAPALFTKTALNGQPINQFGDGSSSRDYTYIEDIIDGIMKALDKNIGFEIINLGNSHPVTLFDFIKTVEKALGKKVMIKKLSKQHGDVENTWANVIKAKTLLNWKPKYDLKSGIGEYTKWFISAEGQNS